MNTPLIDFVVCARNNRAIIAATLDAIAGQTVQNTACTVVDARSTDGTVEFVRERYPWVRVIVKDADDGPARSRNLGYAAGRGEFVAFVDSDVTLAPDWGARQVDAMRGDARLGVLGGKLLHSRAPETLYAAYGVMSRYGVGWDGGRAQPAVEFGAFRRCLWINSSALFARRRMLEETGGFDDAMFLGCEDLDLGWRANVLGWGVAYNPAAVATHEVHGTLDPATMSRRLVYLIWRNRLRASLVNYGAASLLRYTSVFAALSLADAVVRGPRHAKLSALGWNLKVLADTWKRRRWVQSRRRVSDRELMPLFRSGVFGPGYDFAPRSAQFHEPLTARQAIDLKP